MPTATHLLEDRYQDLFDSEQHALESAARNEGAGRPHVAQRCRNQALGFKAARTHLARQMGWMD